ncbi:MAG: YCF48-related protein [Bacteroidota bacterium]
MSKKQILLAPSLPVAVLAFGLLLGCAGSAPLVTQWEYTGGPYAQNISSILVSGTSSGLIYAGLSTGDLFVSSNSGQTWSKASTLRSGARIVQLLEDPEVEDKLYAATTAGAYVSPDAGKQWRELPIAGEGSSIACLVLAVDPWKPSVLYAGTKGHGMFTSTDGGKIWSPVLTGDDSTISLGDVHDIKIDVQRPDNLYASFSSVGLMKSTDAGATWIRLTQEYSSTGARITRMLVHTGKQDHVIFGTSTGNILKSTTGGSTWSPVRQGLVADRIYSLAVHPEDPDYLIAGTGTGILRSADFGTTWQTVSNSLPNLPVSIAVSPIKTRCLIYASGEGIGLQVSADSGRRWDPVDENLGGAKVHLIRSDRSGNSVFAASGHTILRYKPSAKTWVPASTGLKGDDVYSLAVDPDSASVLLASTPYGVFKTSDAGALWRQTSRKLSMIPVFLDSHPWIPTRLFASGQQGIFASTDKGNSWAQSKPIESPYTVRNLTFTPTNAGVIYGASGNGVLTTENGGFTWESARFGLTNLDIVAITLDAEDPKTSYAWTTDGSCFRSTNSGLEWSNYTPPWQRGERVQIVFDRYAPSSTVAVVEGSRVYFSPNGGGTWVHLLDKGFPLDVLAVHWNASSGILYVGTREQGVFRLPLKHIIAEKFGR